MPCTWALTYHSDIRTTDGTNSATLERIKEDGLAPSKFILSKQEETTKKWVDKEMGKSWPINNEMFEKKVTKSQMSRRIFDAIVTNYLYERHLGFLQDKTYPNSINIFVCIKSLLSYDWCEPLNCIQNFTSIGVIKCVTFFGRKRNPSPYPLWMNLTSNGWFILPESRGKIDYSNITKQSYDFLKEQDMKFDHILSLLPKLEESPAYFKKLVSQFGVQSGALIGSSKYSLFNRFIANEILLDIREILHRYKSLIGFKSIKLDESTTTAKEEKNY